MYHAIITYTDGSQANFPLLQAPLEDGYRLTLPREILQQPTEYVDFMPDFLAFEGEDGYFTYHNYLIRFLGHEDALLETGVCQMPLLGIKTPRECYACIITQLKEQHSFVIQCKDGVYSAHVRFLLQGQVPENDMQVEYHALHKEKADYNGIAQTYQTYQLNKGGCKLIRDRMNDDLAYTVDAPEIRIRMAWKPVPTPVEEQTTETEPPMHIAVTFKQAGQIMDACKAHGVEKAEFCLVGWNIRGHDGRWPQAFPVEEALGGEEALKELISKAQAMGYHIVCHTNATDCYSISNRWSEELPMRDRQGTKQKNAQWGGGRMYNMCPVSGGEAFVAEDLPKIRALGFRGIHYIDVITCVAPYHCFSPQHPCSPQEFVRSMRRSAQLSRNLFGGFQSEGGYDYLNDVEDMCLYVDFKLLTPPHPLVSENIPMWQLVYHGIVMSNPSPDTVNYPVKDWKSQLKFMEYGGHPAIYIHSRFHGTHNWMGDSDLTCSTHQEMEETAEAIRYVQDSYQPVKDLQLQRMVHHCVHGNITVTSYEDGTEVVCNYGETQAAWKGTAISAHGYSIIRA